MKDARRYTVEPLLSRLRSTRGASLAIVVATSLIASVVAYYLLQTVQNQARQSQFIRIRKNARYVAEMGMTYAMEHLWLNPDYCGGAAVPLPTTGSVLPVATDPQVDIAISSCGAGNAHKITVTRHYNN